jgi:hypothetical protein
MAEIRHIAVISLRKFGMHLIIYSKTLDDLYEEATMRQEENSQQIGHNMYSNGLLNGQGHGSLPINPQMAFPTHPPIAQVLPVNTANMGSMGNLAEIRARDASTPIKRQKVSEVADFSRSVSNVPTSKNMNKVMADVQVNEESKAEIGMLSTADVSNRSADCTIIQPKSMPGGIKSVSASITTNYAQNLKEKETEIRLLEQQEESKVINSDINELTLRVQKSIFKSFDPLFYDKESKMIRCF